MFDRAIVITDSEGRPVFADSHCTISVDDVKRDAHGDVTEYSMTIAPAPSHP